MALIVDRGIDIMCITESWLSPRDDALVREVSEYNYGLLSAARGSRGGGVAIVHKNGLKVKKQKVKNPPTTFELLEAEIGGKGIKLSRVAVVYRPPNPGKQTLFLDEFDSFLSTFSSKPGNLIVTGDFNVHVENSTSSFPADFLQILEDHGWIQHVTDPTHILGGTLDLVLTKDVPLVSAVEVWPTPEVPDHFLVEFQAHCGTANHPDDRKVVTGRSLKDLSIDTLKTRINQSKLCDQPLPHSVEECVELYNTILGQLLDELAPIEEKEIKVSTKPPWFTQDCYDALRRRRKAERKYRTACKRALRKKNCGKQVSHEKVQSAEESFTSEVRYARSVFTRARRLFFQTRIEATEGNPTATYQILNHLLGKDKIPRQLPTVIEPESLPDKMMGFFKTKIEKIYEKIRNDPDFSSQPPEIISTNVDNPPELARFHPVSDDQLVKIIRGMNKKHCTLDPIPSTIVGAALPALLPIVSKIVNRSLSEGFVPANLKEAVIRPSYKSSQLDPDELASYRPISNLSFISKVVEKCVADQLTAHIESNNLFSSVQSAYRSKHSCETATVKIFNDILIQLDKKSKVILVLLDLSAAFDTISHSKLLRRLQTDYGVTGKVLKWIESYLMDRTARVKIGSTESAPEKIEFGVPQGSILGPLLFILYTRDLERIAKMYDLSLHMYADDSQLYVSFAPNNYELVMKKVQQCVEHIQVWMTQNLLKLNADKTEIMILNNKWDKTTTPETVAVVHGEDTGVSSSAKNLGVIFDSELTMSNHVSKVVQACNLHLVNLWRIGNKLTKKQKTLLVNTLIHSRLDYCNGLFIGLREADMKRLQKVQNSATRFVYGQRSRQGATNLRKKSHFLPVRHRIEYKVCLMVYNALNDRAPDYIKQLLQRRKPKAKSLRVDEDETRLVEFHSKYKFTEKAFKYAAPKIWNKLPKGIRTVETVERFKKSLKTHLFSLAYDC